MDKEDVPLKTNDVYKIDKNIPKRFNNPDCFEGYRSVTLGKVTCKFIFSFIC